MCNCCCGENKYFDKLYTILEKYEGKEQYLISILQAVQEQYGFLSREVLEKLSEITGISNTTIMGVATFYAQFRFEPTGKRLIKICFGTACHVNGSEKVAEALMDELKIDLGGTTKDKEFTLESVSCLGCCSLAPVMMIGSETYGRLTPDSARKIIRSFYEKQEG